MSLIFSAKHVSPQRDLHNSDLPRAETSGEESLQLDKTLGHFWAEPGGRQQVALRNPFSQYHPSQIPKHYN